MPAPRNEAGSNTSAIIQANTVLRPRPTDTQESSLPHLNDNSSLQTSPIQDGGATREGTSPRDNESPDDATVSNHLVPEQPTFISDYAGRLRYLGHSSTWSFSCQVLQMASQSSGLAASPSASMHVDGEIYGVTSERQISLSSADIADLPSLELSLYYLQSTKFRTHPFYHLFEETQFIQDLHDFYRNPSEFARDHSLWYVHYLVIMAFGKSFVSQQASIGPAGSDLFSRALSLLPDATCLSRDPVKSTEILCCLALYLHCVDHRVAAHSYIGQAVRMAQSHGLHTDMQPADVGDRLAQHCRLLWWTIYGLERKLTSLMGVPNTILDDDITTQVPQVAGNGCHTAALSIHVKISRLLGSIATTVYGSKEKLKDTFLSTIRKVLKGISELTEELTSFSSQCFGEISRVSAHLNLGYHQCIMLTIRPVLFHLFKQKIESLHVSREFTLLPSIRELIQVLTDSAVQIANILSQLKKHDLLAKHALHEVSLAALIEVFDAMILAGNLLANSRKSEVEELACSLRDQLDRVGEDHDSVMEPPLVNQVPDSSLDGNFGLPSPSTTFFDGWNPDDVGPGSRIGELAESLTLEELSDLWTQ
ncbi:hypothetical protein NM208_g6225 [Fusarium decemcellulare]|uniref:Uncharacterized protein n=1 Tax=Fusarium decemcellulare TaxID=57161 RepID=A0ACC1SE10_9HYPO|nr:hypothetical protein NM208_g6225 [Fusarium decemcellulare]